MILGTLLLVLLMLLMLAPPSSHRRIVIPVVCSLVAARPTIPLWSLGDERRHEPPENNNMLRTDDRVVNDACDIATTR